eukprot:s640_g23.t1
MHFQSLESRGGPDFPLLTVFWPLGSRAGIIVKSRATKIWCPAESLFDCWRWIKDDSPAGNPPALFVFCLDDVFAWLLMSGSAPKASGVTLQSNFVDNLRGFRSQNKLKKAALHIIAGQLNEDQIKALRDTFMGLDKNGDGLLTPAELKEGLQKAGLKEIPPDLQAIMEDVDADGSGVIDYTEFLAATLDRRQYIQEDVCWSAFRVFDRMLGGIPTVDGNGDGVIDFQEFLQMMRGGKVPTGPGGNAL